MKSVDLESGACQRSFEVSELSRIVAAPTEPDSLVLSLQRIFASSQ